MTIGLLLRVKDNYAWQFLVRGLARLKVASTLTVLAVHVPFGADSFSTLLYTIL